MKLAGVALSALLLLSASPAAAEQKGKLVITGSSTVAPLVMEMAKMYENANPGVRIDVQTGGSSRGLSDTRQKVADIGMASRALTPAEVDLQAVTIAYDGIAMIVHRDNPVRELTAEQIIGIYSGKLTNWKDAGGADGPVTVVNKAEGRSTLEMFLQHFKLKNTDIKAHIIIGDNEQGIKTIAGNKGAIGYVSIGSGEYAVSAGVPIRLLPLGGVAPTVANVANRTWPLARPLSLVVLPGADGLKKSFLEFATSARTAALVGEQYFVPVSTK